MRIRISKTLLALILVASLSLASADEYSLFYDAEQVKYIQSDGKLGTNEYSEGDLKVNTSQNTSTTYTSAEYNALVLKQNIQSNLHSWLDAVKNPSGHDIFFYTTTDGHLLEIDIGLINKEVLDDLLTDISHLKDYTNTDGAGWVNTNDYAPSLMTGADLSNLFFGDLTRYKYEIAKRLNPFCNLYDTSTSTIFIFSENDMFQAFFSNGKLEVFYSNSGVTGFRPINTIISSLGNAVREDIYIGYPALKDYPIYSDRFQSWFEDAENNPNWEITTDPVTGMKTYNYTYDSSSATMNDYISVGVLTDYSIYSIEKNHVSSIDYTSDLRRWTIYKDGNAVSAPLITDNPRHELDFNQVYELYGAGTYRVVAEQQALITSGTYVTYDICEYLFDVSSGTILWYSHKMARNNQGGAILINEESSDEPTWVETGDVFNITINELGEVATQTSGINREE